MRGEQKCGDKERWDMKMLKQILRFRSVLVLIFGLSLLSLGAFARADDNRGGNYGDDHRDNHRDNHRNRYHYRDVRWYGQGEIVVPNLVVGAEVESLPPRYTTVVVGNTPYYYDNARYYNRLSDGAYVVVEAPRRPGININVHL